MNDHVTINQGTDMVPVADDEGALKGACEFVAATEVHVTEGYTANRDLAVGLLARAQYQKALSKIIDIGQLVELKRAKDQKVWLSLRGAPVLLPSGERRVIKTWAEYCEALGLAVSTVDKRLEELKTIGQDALDALQSAGVTRTQIRAIQQLPDDERSVLIGKVEVAANDPEAIKEEVALLVGRHAEEKRRLEREVNDSRGREEKVYALLAAEQQKSVALEQRLEGAISGGGDELLRFLEVEKQAFAALSRLLPERLEACGPESRQNAFHVARLIANRAERIAGMIMDVYSEDFSTDLAPEPEEWPEYDRAAAAIRAQMHPRTREDALSAQAPFMHDPEGEPLGSSGSRFLEEVLSTTDQPEKTGLS
jgi:hypothetical protein